MFRKSTVPFLVCMGTLLLASCGGGGGGNNNPPANVAPTANAGSAQTVTSGTVVTLNGTASSDSDGSIASYVWTQTVGTAVTLSGAATAQPSFTAPTVGGTSTLTFSLVVTDNRGASSAAATVSITVNPAGAGNVTLTGTVRFMRVPLTATPSAGLKFASQTLQPARGVNVQALNATTQVVLATGSTDGTGGYSLSVPANTQITLQVIARMQRTGSPSWDVRVQNGTAAATPVNSYFSPAFSSSAGTQNVDIPSGIDSTGTATGTRASGSFAILDTIYTAIQAVIAPGVAPTTAFPTLYVDWGSQSDGTFFSTANGQHIALLSDLSEDTDEFDQHVVAHEFGHYVEHNFSRSDSIGGSHGLGDRLDLRVAFGEGFGYGFAAIVLNEPIVLDSFFNGAHVAGGFNIENNPPLPGGSDGPGCWCSESTVWSFLWDLVDPASGAGMDNDGVALPGGLASIWQVMVGAQRTTPAMTSIFSFATALKVAQPAAAAQIDARLALNNMVAATMNEFATTETYEPFAPVNNVLPMYTTVTVGTPVVVRSIDDGETYNRAGNRRFMRFVPPTTRLYNVNLTTSNTNVGANAADPDLLIWRSGTIVAAFDSAPSQEPAQTETGSVTLTSGVTYIIDAYDCANGCPPDPPQGVAGDYDLTLTIN